MTANNPPTYSLLMWHRRQFSSESHKIDNTAEERCSGLKLTDSCVKVCMYVHTYVCTYIHMCIHVCVL